jgi:AraC family transcriptional regulator
MTLQHDAGPDRSSVLHVFTVPVPAGVIESPPERFHAIDIHLGTPVQVACRIDGRERRGVQTQGQFCVLPAGATGRWAMTRPAEALLLMLAPSLVQDTADALGLRGAAPLVPSIQARDPQLERIAWILRAEHEDGYPGGRLFTDSLASALATRLLRLPPNPAPDARSSSRGLPPRRLRSVIEYIEAHLDQDLTLSELATVAGFSVSHFKPLFKHAVGVPVHRYVVERRVELARRLLVTGRLTMAEIAVEAGFAHQSHMARCMRRVLGLSPSQIAIAAG